MTQFGSEHDADTQALEALVDLHGITAVVAALGAICYGKAEHLRSNWQDSHAAREWERIAKPIDATVVKLEKITG